MSIIEWDEKYSVNISELDNQHKEIISILNDIHNYRFQKKPKKTEEIINLLINYIKLHFSTEEQYLMEHKYPDIQTHKSEHAKFIVKIYEYQEDFLTNESFSTGNLFDFVWDWFTDHVLITDKKYQLYFEQHINN